MNLLPIKLLGAVAVAGLVAAGGTAFTATGVTSAASATQAVGVGEVTQSVIGAVVSDVTYTSDTNGVVDKVTVTFATPLQTGAVVELDAFTGGGNTTPLPNNQNVAASGGVNPVYEFELDGAVDGDLAGTDSLTGIAITVS